MGLHRLDYNSWPGSWRQTDYPLEFFVCSWIANSQPVSWILPYPSLMMLVKCQDGRTKPEWFYLSLYVLYVPEDHPGYFLIFLKKLSVKTNHIALLNSQLASPSTSMFLSWCFSCAQSLSWVWLFATPWTVALQAPLSMGFSRQEYWSGLPLPPPGDLPNTETEPASVASLALVGGFFTPVPPGKPNYYPWNCQEVSTSMGKAGQSKYPKRPRVVR